MPGELAANAMVRVKRDTNAKAANVFALRTAAARLAGHPTVAAASAMDRAVNPATNAATGNAFRPPAIPRVTVGRRV